MILYAYNIAIISVLKQAKMVESIITVILVKSTIFFCQCRHKENWKLLVAVGLVNIKPIMPVMYTDLFVYTVGSYNYYVLYRHNEWLP